MDAIKSSRNAPVETTKPMTTNQLIDQLVTEGGAIVTSGECSEMEIADAQATGRFSVREDGIGFVRRYSEWLALQLDREKAQETIREQRHRIESLEADNLIYSTQRKKDQTTTARFAEAMTLLRREENAESMVARLREILLHNETSAPAGANGKPTE